MDKIYPLDYQKNRKGNARFKIPKTEVIQFLLHYSKSINVLKSKMLGEIVLIKN